MLANRSCTDSAPRITRLAAIISVIAVAHLVALPAVAADWLQWGGPRGDFTVDTPPLADAWPTNGPPVLWKRELGAGYTSILVKDDRLYTMYRDGDEEVVVCLDADSGKNIWEHRYTTGLWSDMDQRFGLGPNVTPAIVGDRIVSISIDGKIRCLDLLTGTLKWKHDLVSEYGRRTRDEEYGYSGSPLVYKGKVIVLVGGTDHAVVAFDPKDGTVAWASAPGGISYAAPMITTLSGREQYIYFSPEGVNGLDPNSGKTLWSFPIEYNNGNHLTPVVRCADDAMWVGSQFSSGGGRLLRFESSGATIEPKQAWFKRRLQASHWTNVRIGPYMYGSVGGNRVSFMACFNWQTGELKWRKRGFHKAQCLYADGKLIFLDEDGQLAMARVSPESFDVLSKVQISEGLNWTLPTLVKDRLYLRDLKIIQALDLGKR